MEAAEDLIAPTWLTDGIEVIGEENIDSYFKAVTNYVQEDTAARFIDLKITEIP